VKIMTEPLRHKTVQIDLFAAASQVSKPQSWFTPSNASRLASIGIHCALVTLAMIPWTAGLELHPKQNETAIMLWVPPAALSKPLRFPSEGGGGGGKQQPRPPSRGDLPRNAEKQLAPPDPEPPKNPDPSLIVEPTIVAPQWTTLRPLDVLKIGDPYGVVGPPSSGPADGGGIGDGDGRGVGIGKGPGAIDGDSTGCCGTYRVGGEVTAPAVVFRVEPQYSEEARKARYQGTVLLEAVIRKDGKVDVIQLVRSLGFGLDENAIEALKEWRFRPAMKNGVPVDVTLNVEVRFNLR
jgi:TonB family protein